MAASLSGPEAFFLLMAAGVTASFLAVGARAMRNHAASCRHLVEVAVFPYRGRVVNAGWFEPDRAEFELDGVRCRMTWQDPSGEDPQQTTIFMDWRSGAQLRVRPEGAWMELRKAFGAEDVEIGDPAFDSFFQVEGIPARAKESLTSRVRAELMLWRETGVSLEAGPGGTFFRVHKNISDSAMQLSLFLQSAERLLRALRGAATGVKFLEEPAGGCATCRAPLEGSVVRCARCGARQHADCWTYVGGCAVYACGSTRST
jgi:hypothetical protein